VFIRSRPALGRELTSSPPAPAQNLERRWTDADGDRTPGVDHGQPPNNRFVGCLGMHPDSGRVFVSSKDRPVVLDALSEHVPEGVRLFRGFHGVLDGSATQEDMFSRVALPAIQAVKQGVHAAILAYGQTSTGKTHTMLGDTERPGLLPRIARALLRDAGPADQAAAPEAKAEEDPATDEPAPRPLEITVSYVQIYLSRVSDLLNQGAPVRLRGRGGDCIMEDATQVPLRSMDDLAGVLAEGAQGRRVASTKLNSTSSRSHAIVTLEVTSFAPKGTVAPERATRAGQVLRHGGGVTGAHHGAGVVATRARLYLVDLAGSENVKESGTILETDGTRLKEASHINRSLFGLVQVVEALVAQAEAQGRTQKPPAVVPYRNDPLTMVLRDALGGNCATALVATLSPAQQHAAANVRTLNFAAACQGVRNTSQINTVRLRRSELPWNRKPRRFASQAPPPPPRSLPWQDVTLGSEACPGQSLFLETPHGRLHALSYGPGKRQAERGLAVCVHGCPSDASSWHWLIPALVCCGYHCLCLDLPGSGRSPGDPLPSHSKHNLDSGGVVDVLCAALDALNVDKASWVGYDSGAGAVLSMALARRHRCRRIVAFHPSYHEQRKGELGSVSTPVLVLWVKQDQFHPLAAAKRGILQSLPTRCVELKVFSQSVRNRQKGNNLHRGGRSRRGGGDVEGAKEGGYGADPTIGPLIQREIALFLGGAPGLEADAKHAAMRTDMGTMDAKGEAVREQRNIVFTQDVGGGGGGARKPMGTASQEREGRATSTRGADGPTAGASSTPNDAAAAAAAAADGGDHSGLGVVGGGVAAQEEADKLVFGEDPAVAAVRDFKTRMRMRTQAGTSTSPGRAKGTGTKQTIAAARRNRQDPQHQQRSDKADRCCYNYSAWRRDDSSLVGVFSRLPELSPSALEREAQGDASWLIHLGLWKECPHGLRHLQTTAGSSPRYFPGRQVLVRAPVDPRVTPDGSYMALLPYTGEPPPSAAARRRASSRPLSSAARSAPSPAPAPAPASSSSAAAALLFTTHRARLLGTARNDEDMWVVEVDAHSQLRQNLALDARGRGVDDARDNDDRRESVEGKQGGDQTNTRGPAGNEGTPRRLLVPRSEVLRLNQPHVFLETTSGGGGELRFEDGLRMRYSSPLAKAKMCEIAMELDEVVGQLDFTPGASPEEAQRRERVQIECIRRIVACLNITTFQRGLDRSRCSSMCDDIAQFAVHGQGHCHTVSSVAAAFLAPWQHLCGFDLCYRGGQHFGSTATAGPQAQGQEGNAASSLAGTVVSDSPEKHQWLEVTLRPTMRRLVCDLWIRDTLHVLGRNPARGSSFDPLAWEATEAYQTELYPHGRCQIKQAPAPLEKGDVGLSPVDH